MEQCLWIDKAQIIEAWTPFPFLKNAFFKFFFYFFLISGCSSNLNDIFCLWKNTCFYFHLVVYKACGFFCSEDLEKDVEFEVVGDTPENVGPKPSEPTSKNITNGSDDGAQPSTSTGKSQ